jgi:putative redox protein
MDVKVTWNGNLNFTGTAGTGISIPIDTSIEGGGSGAGISPMQLVAIGLAGCTGMDVISILEKKRQEVTAFEVKVSTERAESHPHVFTHMLVEYVITGRNIDPNAAERAVELSTTRYCSVQAMLQKTAQIEHKITLLEPV